MHAAAVAAPEGGGGGREPAVGGGGGGGGGDVAAGADGDRSSPPQAAAGKTQDGEDGGAAEEDAVADPTKGFEEAREVVGRLHECLTKLQALKPEGSSVEDVEANAYDAQLQLLALRRVHHANTKSVDQGRRAEANARRIVDQKFAHLETRRYESACSRAGARRCRTFPTPQLSKLRPHLERWEEKDGDDPDDDLRDGGADADGDAPEGTAGRLGGLARHLEAEKRERARLEGELEGLEEQQKRDLEELREGERRSAELVTRIRAAERALEPVCDLLELRARPEEAEPPLDRGIWEQLPTPLRLVFTKFDVLAAFSGEEGVSVRVALDEEEPEAAQDRQQPPAAKRARVEGGGCSGGSGAPCICVDIASGGEVACLRFTNPHASIVKVHVEGTLGADGGASLLSGLWPDDHGGAALLPMPKDITIRERLTAAPGRPYYWAQVLAGLREQVVLPPGSVGLASPFLAMESVWAMDVLTRVRARMAARRRGSA